MPAARKTNGGRKPNPDLLERLKRATYMAHVLFHGDPDIIWDCYVCLEEEWTEWVNR